jgi:Arc/MetJ family transcription regulator
MRTRIHIDESVLRDLMKHATASGQTLSAVVEDAVRQYLRRTVSGGGLAAAPFRVITFKSRLQPGINLDKSAALLDVMARSTLAEDDTHTR